MRARTSFDVMVTGIIGIAAIALIVVQGQRHHPWEQLASLPIPTCSMPGQQCNEASRCCHGDCTNGVCVVPPRKAVSLTAQLVAMGFDPASMPLQGLETFGIMLTSLAGGVFWSKMHWKSVNKKNAVSA